MDFFQNVNHQNHLILGEGNIPPGPPIFPKKNSGCIPFILILILSISSFIAFGQSSIQASNICDGLTTKSPLPMSYSGPKNPLIPDPCNAKDSYGSSLFLNHSPVPGYVEIQKQVRVLSESIWDPKSCQMISREISRDTIVVQEQTVPETLSKNVGGYWTIRMELMIKPPTSRPVGTLVSKLPNTTLKDYWVVHVGSSTSKEEIQKYLNPFKIKYPEFCRAYIYFLPPGIEYQYEYR